MCTNRHGELYSFDVNQSESEKVNGKLFLINKDGAHITFALLTMADISPVKMKWTFI